MYSLAACAFTWPLALHLNSLLGAEDPTGDPSLYLWVLGWDFQTISTHFAWLFNGRVFDAPIFHPAANTLAYSDHLLLQAVGLWPLYALTDDLVLCYNVLLIASLVAAALAMHALARSLTNSESASYIAGLIFGFAPFHFTHLIHIQLQALYFLPLSFLMLDRLFMAERNRRDTFACGAVVGLQAISSVYYGVIGSIGLAFGAIFLLVAAGRMRDWRLIRRCVVAAAIAIVVALPWLIPYLQASRDAGGGRSLAEAERGSAVWSSYLQAPVTNLVYGRSRLLRPGPDAHIPFKEGPEQPLFVGFGALALAVFGAVVASAGSRRKAALYGAVALLGLLLSFGPNGLRPVYSILYQGLLGMAAIRAPARFSVLTLLGIAALAALAIRELERRRPHMKRLVGATAFALIAVEYSNGAIAFPTPPPLITDAGRWLAEQPGSGAVLCAPMGPFTSNTPCMLQSLEHRRAIVNGYSGIRPPFFEALMDAVNRIPDAQSLLTLHDVGVDFVVSDGPLALDVDGAEALVERAAFDDQRVYQVVWSTALEGQLTSVTDATPPEPGPTPFSIGESATYQIRWTSGPVNVPAGEAVISVQSPGQDDHYRFVVTARTATWMSRFYKADVLLETLTSDRLTPVTHSETITAGGRHIERNMTFDYPRGELQLTSGGSTIALPLGAGARDPISTLFYVRTLPLAEGANLALPLNDNGRSLKLNLTVVRRETVTVNGRTLPAWRLEPRVTDRIERRGPLDITVWLSADARRVPLLVEVTAAFGSAQLELTAYGRG